MNNLFSEKRRIFSVSELTKEIKEVLEETFPFVWVAGEISNLHTPGSGHHYFTLKDEDASLSAVMFRGQNRNLSFILENGMSVLAMGRINVYEPRGSYQIIIEYLEPGGTGALQRAFEQLKEKLAAEGLFEETHKKTLPFLPKTIAVVTSPTGSVIRDILHVIDRRFPTVEIQIAPVRVQGEGSAEDISHAITMLNERAEADVIIIARGGGSLEDLQAFNSELVARAVFNSIIPVVSAVGHETDFTICDFASDHRAPTPSAAAEIITPQKSELNGYLEDINHRLKRALNQKVLLFAQRLTGFRKRLIPPQKKLDDYRLRLDDMHGRLCRARQVQGKEKVKSFYVMNERLLLASPLKQTKTLNQSLEHCNKSLLNSMIYQLELKRNAFQVVFGSLNALNPISVLERGYSVTRTQNDDLIKNAAVTHVGQRVKVTLWRGELVCNIEEKKDGQTNF